MFFVWYYALGVRYVLGVILCSWRQICSSCDIMPLASDMFLVWYYALGVMICSWCDIMILALWHILGVILCSRRHDIFFVWYYALGVMIYSWRHDNLCSLCDLMPLASWYVIIVISFPDVMICYWRDLMLLVSYVLGVIFCSGYRKYRKYRNSFITG